MWLQWFTGARPARLRGGANGDRSGSQHGPASTPPMLWEATFGPAARTATAPDPHWRPPIDLRARAERVCNRNARLVERYLDLHRVLMKGRGG